MKTKEIMVTEFDRNRLEGLLGNADTAFENGLRGLQAELDRAIVVAPEDIPPDVITMNSTVRMRDVENSEEMTYTLVFPKHADITRGAISVLAPVGMAILGFAEGDVVEWPVPSGTAQIAIEKVLYQPEAAGDFHL
jgi:regulator of nucleoside diphosphate kinase